MGRRPKKSTLFTAKLRQGADQRCAASLARKLENRPMDTELETLGYAVMAIDVTSTARLDSTTRKLIIDRISAENDRLLQDKNGGMTILYLKFMFLF